MAAHVAGDPDAFPQLVRRHRNRLWAVAVRTMGGRTDDAEDALQEAMISAFRSAASYRGEAAVTTWLHRIVVNACLDRIRRRAARPAGPLGDHDVASPVDAFAQTDARLTVRVALAKLAPEQQQALVLVDIEDYSIAEAAKILGIPEGTVKSRAFRARTALAALLRTSAEGSDALDGNQSGSSRVAPSDGSATGELSVRRSARGRGDTSVKAEQNRSTQTQQRQQQNQESQQRW